MPRENAPALLKVDLHLHSGEDPKDGLPYPATTIIDMAVKLGFGALAFTLHGKVLDDPRLFDYARAHGLLLIPAVEWRIRGRDVLLYNITAAEAHRIRTYNDLRAWRADRGTDCLVVAPHPFYPARHSLRRDLLDNMDCFDAIEHAQLHLPWYNPNQRALAVARAHGKPVLATSDAHNLWMFGRHYALVHASASIPALFAAIRAGRIQNVSEPVTVRECLRTLIFDPIRFRRRGRITASFSD